MIDVHQKRKHVKKRSVLFRHECKGTLNTRFVVSQYPQQANSEVLLNGKRLLRCHYLNLHFIITSSIALFYVDFLTFRLHRVKVYRLLAVFLPCLGSDTSTHKPPSLGLCIVRLPPCFLIAFNAMLSPKPKPSVCIWFPAR